MGGEAGGRAAAVPAAALEGAGGDVLLLVRILVECGGRVAAVALTVPVLGESLLNDVLEAGDAEVEVLVWLAGGIGLA